MMWGTMGAIANEKMPPVAVVFVGGDAVVGVVGCFCC